MYKFGFIVNTYSRPVEVLQACLYSISSQMPQNSIIVLVDQNTNALDFTPLQVRKVHMPDKRISVARNVGAATVEAEWYIFIDDDGELKPGALESLEKYLQGQQCDVIGGRIEIKGTNKSYSIRQNIPEGNLNLLFLKAVMGGLLAIKGTTYQELKGFDINFGVGSVLASGEESDFCLRGWQAGKAIHFLPSFTLSHPAPTELSLEKIQAYALGKGALLKKMYRGPCGMHLLTETLDTFLVPLVDVLIGCLTLNYYRLRVGKLKLINRYKGFIGQF